MTVRPDFFWARGIPTIPVDRFVPQVPWLPAAMLAIRESLEARALAKGEVLPQWAQHKALLGPPIQTTKQWHVWELPESGWYMWTRLWVPQFTPVWLEIPAKDARPEVAAKAVQAYWESLGIGLWKDLVRLTAQFQGKP